MRCKECKRKLKAIGDTKFYCDSSPNMCSLSTKTINKYNKTSKKQLRNLALFPKKLYQMMGNGSAD